MSIVAVPGSKSIANRALVCAALADGTSHLTNVPDGDDTMAMIACLRSLGLDAELAEDQVSITGTGPEWSDQPHTLHAALAGTTSRFVTALASLGTAPVTIDGYPPLRRRPFAPLHDALVQLGVGVEPNAAWGQLPVTVHGPPTSGVVAIPGEISSQYVTALMLIGPYLPGGLQLELTSPLVSRPYVEMTAAIMATFGIEGIAVSEHAINVEAGRYRATELMIEPDASSASYPLAVAAITGRRVEIDGLGYESLQGDAMFATLLSQMGCDVDQQQHTTSVTRVGDARLEGIEVDMADISDLVPTVAAVALFAATATRITGVGFIRGKESDRLGDLTDELRKLGADLDETDDGLLIRPSADRLHGAPLETHHDHRLAMAFGVISTRVAGIEIDDADVVSKSWPAFWTMLDGLA